MGRNYNYIYKKLVEDEGDVVGHIAYSIYKANKIEFIEKFKDDHNGVEPTDAELQPFHDMSCTQSSIDLYQMKAETVISEFLEEVLASHKRDIEEDYAHKQDLHLKDIVEPLRPKWWKQLGLSIIASILGALLFAFLVAMIAFTRANNRNDTSVSVGDSIEQLIEDVLTKPETHPFDTVQ